MRSEASAEAYEPAGGFRDGLVIHPKRLRDPAVAQARTTISGVTARLRETGGGPIHFARLRPGMRPARGAPSKARAIDRFGARRVVLFGSRARGDARSDSDFDVFVEMESTDRPPERNARILAEIGLRPWSLDLLVYTPDEVARVRPIPGTLLSMIESEGRVLHDAA